jgi:hypothetical protein
MLSSGYSELLRRYSVNCGLTILKHVIFDIFTGACIRNKKARPLRTQFWPLIHPDMGLGSPASHRWKCDAT